MDEDDFRDEDGTRDDAGAFIHPETGELLATEEDWRQAIGALEERLSGIYRDLWPLRDGYAERFPPAELPPRRARTETQEKVARCPRCGERIKAVPGCPCSTCVRLRGESEGAAPK